MRAFNFGDGYRAEPCGDGEYHVRRVGGYKIPGLVIGGHSTWAVQLGGEQWRQTYPSAREACKALVRHDARASIDAETRRHEWQPA